MERGKKTKMSKRERVGFYWHQQRDQLETLKRPISFNIKPTRKHNNSLFVSRTERQNWY